MDCRVHRETQKTPQREIEVALKRMKVVKHDL